MGGAKRDWEDAMERGWNAPDKFVCVNCVEDEFLQQLIIDSFESEDCDYCDSGSQGIMAAPVEVIIEAVSKTLHNYYNDIESSGVPRVEGSYPIDPIDTDDVLSSLPFHAQDTLFNDIAESFLSDAWVPTANGWWGGSHQSVILKSAWQRFCFEVKEKSRYFFTQTENETDPFRDHEDISALSLMESIGSESEDLGLIMPLIINSKYYRVRNGHNHVSYSDIGPPQVGIAGSGRMNPEGISYFYLADNELTAIAETRLVDGDKASLATFQLNKELKVLNFSITMGQPSVFDPDSYYLSEMINFWNEFKKQIGKPVDKKNSLDYIPTQVLSEYFAKVFRCKDDSKIDGFIYPSATSSPGNNLVLFPESHQNKGWEEVAKLINTKNIVVHSSIDSFKCIKV